MAIERALHLAHRAQTWAVLLSPCPAQAVVSSLRNEAHTENRQRLTLVPATVVESGTRRS